MDDGELGCGSEHGDLPTYLSPLENLQSTYLFLPYLDVMATPPDCVRVVRARQWTGDTRP